MLSGFCMGDGGGGRKGRSGGIAGAGRVMLKIRLLSFNFVCDCMAVVYLDGRRLMIWALCIY